ncbi:MAG TPA: AsmA-like C-terminal region-containing protein [Bacteroidia bacterium]|nr:AsmA-like C-terminal region-containing protein [Bacteroidia bacterium]
MNLVPDNNTISSISPIQKFIQKIGRVILYIILSCTALIGIAVGIGVMYESEVKQYVINELNKQLNTPVIIDTKDINFSIIKNFPYASVDFKNLKAMDAIKNKNKDTLFKASRISFQFNLPDIFKKNYHIKKIEIDNVVLNIRIDENGEDNYHFWKKSTDTTNTNFAFALEKIKMTQIRVIYKNHQQHQTTDLTINESDLSGEFSEKKYALKTTGELFIHTIQQDSIYFLKKKNVFIDLTLNVDNAVDAYKIGYGKIKIEDLTFETGGEVFQASTQPILNIAIKGKDMDIKSLLSLIPKQYKKKIEEYKSTGDFYFDASIQGAFTTDQSPQIIADFGMRNATIEQTQEKIMLKNVNLKGHYTNGSLDKKQPSALTLKSFSATINKEQLKGELSILNFSNPSVNGKITATFNLSELQHFVKLDTIQQISGMVVIDALFKANNRDANTGLYKEVTTAGDLAISNMNLQLKNNILKFSNINGDFKFNNNDLIVNHFSGNVSSSDFELKGFFRNIVGYVLKDKQDIDVEATLHSKMINLNEILANKQADEAKQSKYKLKFSEHINVNLNSEIEELKFRKFTAKEIKGIVQLKDRKLVIDPITLSTMGGIIHTSGVVDGSDTTNLVVTCFSDFNKINISQLFSEFENFGQTSIMDKNIKGLATCKLQFFSEYSPELKMDMDKLYVGADLSIENGELNNVESMKSLSRFIDLKELENIRFATLKNQIEIKKQMVTIPKMEIRSSAINLTTSGTHGFDGKINYRIKLSLNELLSGKAKRAKKENDEFGQVADDGLGRTNLFLRMTGTTSHPVIKYDSKSAVQNVKQDLKVEKQNFKGLLKDEFGLFKKDTTLPQKAPVEKGKKSAIKWQEADKKTEKKELKKPKKEEEDF